MLVFLLFIFSTHASEYKAVVYSNTIYGFDAPRSIIVSPSRDIWVANGNSMSRIMYGDFTKPAVIYKGNNYFLNNRIVDFVVDSKNNVWILSKGYDDQSDSLTKIPSDITNNPMVYPSGQYKLSSVGGIAIDSKDNIWIINSDSSIVQISNNDTTFYSSDDYRFNSPIKIVIDHNDNVWVLNSNMANTITLLPINNRSRPIVYRMYDGFNNQVDMDVDSNNNIYVINKEDGTIAYLPYASPNKPIIFPNIYGIVSPNVISIDKMNNIWISDYNSVVIKIQSGDIRSFTKFSGLDYCFNSPTSISFDAKGNVWITNAASSSITKLESGSF